MRAAVIGLGSMGRGAALSLLRAGIDTADYSSSAQAVTVDLASGTGVDEVAQDKFSDPAEAVQGDAGHGISLSREGRC